MTDTPAIRARRYRLRRSHGHVVLQVTVEDHEALLNFLIETRSLNEPDAAFHTRLDARKRIVKLEQRIAALEATRSRKAPGGRS